MSDELYALAANYNVAQGSLVRISTINPGDGDLFDPPKGLPLYDEGIVVAPLGGIPDTEGYATVTWFFTRMTYAQYAYLKSTYCGGGLGGKVTIYTTLGSDSWTRRNAVMIIKKAKEIRSEYRFQDVEVLFTKLAVPS